jgi:hypothetical protein
VSRLSRGICYVPSQGKRFLIDLNGSFEAYLGKFRKKTRYTMRRKLRVFSQHSDRSGRAAGVSLRRGHAVRANGWNDSGGLTQMQVGPR